MRRALVLLMALGLVAPTFARAAVLRFEGVARIELHEILTHGDQDSVGTEIVDIELELTGPDLATYGGPAVGSARLTRAGGEVTTIPLAGSMVESTGASGFVGASGIGDDLALYCFRIIELSGATPPHADRVVAAFEPGARLAEGHGEDITTAITQDPAGGVPLVPTDNCWPLESRYGPPLSGDFFFTSIP